MRACNSDRRAVVAAGVRPLARRNNAATSSADSIAPVKADASQGATAVTPVILSKAQP